MTQTIVDRETFTLTFQRTIRASCSDVFDAWTMPDQVSEWWDPTGKKLVKCTIDLCVGGAFSFENDGHGPPFAGRYTVVERPTALAFEAMGSFGTVLLASEGKTTRMRVTIRCATAQQFEQFLKMGVHEGTEKTLDNLVRRFQATPASAQAR